MGYLNEKSLKTVLTPAPERGAFFKDVARLQSRAAYQRFEKFSNKRFYQTADWLRLPLMELNKDMNEAKTDYFDFTLKFVSNGLWTGGAGLDVFRVSNGLDVRSCDLVVHLRKPADVFDYLRNLSREKSFRILEDDKTMVVYDFIELKKDQWIPDLVITSKKITNGVNLSFLGSYEKVQWIYDLVKTKFLDESIKVHVIESNSNGISTNDRFIHKEETRLPHQAFYPWMDVSPEEYYRDYLSSGKSTLVLVGPPGTGKTTFLRNLMMFFNRPDCEINLITNGATPRHPDFMEFFSNAAVDNSMMVFEDADEFIRSREEHNLELSGVLGAADGIFSQDAKIVFSTNLPSVGKIDEALIRPGRAYKILSFRLLTPDEANLARAAIGLEPKPFTQDVTLAAALNYEDEADLKSRTKTRVGIA